MGLCLPPPHNIGMILAKPANIPGDTLIYRFGLSLKECHNLGHVLNRLDLDLSEGLVPAVSLRSLTAVADEHVDGPKQILCFATLILPALEIFFRQQSELHQEGSPGAFSTNQKTLSFLK